MFKKKFIYYIIAIMYYFDWAATTPISKEALETYINISQQITGNPSSEHPLGVIASGKLNEFRSKISNILNIDQENLYFTSGGTESDSIIMSSLFWSINPGEVIIGATEHSAVLGFSLILKKMGWKVIKTKPTLEAIEKAISSQTRLVAVMAVSNITGEYYPIKEISTLIRKKEKDYGRKIHFHTDAVQAVGKTLFDLKSLGVDSAAISAHKIQGPRGIGILYNKNKSLQSISPGGGQERTFRPGTENLPAIGALYTALQSAYDNHEKYFNNAVAYKEFISKNITNEGIVINSPINSSPYILSASAIGIPSQVFLRVLSDKGFCLSAGSACSTNQKGKTEAVLTTMGLNPEKRMSTFRISTGFQTTMDECEALVKAINSTYKELRR